MSEYRIRFEYDPDAEFEESNGENRPLTEEEYRGAEYMQDGKPVSYTDYRAYYGNPDRHVYLGAIVEKRCSCCGTWKTDASLWRIDVMDDDPEAYVVGQTFELERLHAIPGYLRSIACELFDEAGAEMPSIANRPDLQE
jgi:hypothetical protein